MLSTIGTTDTTTDTGPLKTASQRWQREVEKVTVRSWIDGPGYVPIIQRHQALLVTASVVNEANDNRSDHGVIQRAAGFYRVRNKQGRFVDVGNGIMRFLEDPHSESEVEAKCGGYFVDLAKTVQDVADRYRELGPGDAFMYVEDTTVRRIVDGIMAATRAGLRVSIEAAGTTVMVSLWEWSGTRRRSERTGFAEAGDDGVTLSVIATAFDDTHWETLKAS